MSRNYNSSVNQDIKGKLVGREVNVCVSGLIEYILQKSYEDTNAPFSWDDVENYYIDNSEEIEELQEQIDELEELEELTQEQKEQLEKLNDKIEELENEQEEPQEIYEWWSVSNWFADKLKAKGQCILSDGWNSYWGRCTSGQAILLDHVISEIAEDMEILEGMANDWSKFK